MVCGFSCLVDSRCASAIGLNTESDTGDVLSDWVSIAKRYGRKKGITTSSKKLLGTKGIATSNKGVAGLLEGV